MYFSVRVRSIQPAGIRFAGGSNGAYGLLVMQHVLASDLGSSYVPGAPPTPADMCISVFLTVVLPCAAYTLVGVSCCA